VIRRQPDATGQARIRVSQITEATMAEKQQFEFYVAINEEGGFIVTKDDSDALQKLGEDEGGYAARVIKMTLLASLPKIVEAAPVEAPDEADDAEAQVA
jgi:hypothetical protein